MSEATAASKANEEGFNGERQLLATFFFSSRRRCDLCEAESHFFSVEAVLLCVQEAIFIISFSAFFFSLVTVGMGGLPWVVRVLFLLIFTEAFGFRRLNHL